MRDLREAIETLKARTIKLLTKNGQLNEQETKSALVTPMLRALGWDCEDPDEVRWEYRYKSQDNPVDYAIFVAGRPRLFIEAKALGRDLGEHKWRAVAVNYANTAGVDWCVLTDGNFWQIYKSNAPGDLERKLFLETWLHSPKGTTPPYEPAYVLSLLSRRKLADNEIEILWRVLNVDRRGGQVLTDLVRGKDAGLVRLIQKHSGLTKADVIAFLDRAQVSVETFPPPPDDERGKKKRGGRVPGLPTQRQLEIPLLRAILRRGGEVNVREQGDDIDRELADEFKVTEEQRQVCFPNRSETIWSNRIRWTRMRLVKTGDLDGSRRGIWALTEQGRKRIEKATKGE